MYTDRERVVLGMCERRLMGNFICTNISLDQVFYYISFNNLQRSKLNCFTKTDEKPLCLLAKALGKIMRRTGSGHYVIIKTRKKQFIKKRRKDKSKQLLARKILLIFHISPYKDDNTSPVIVRLITSYYFFGDVIRSPT